MAKPAGQIVAAQKHFSDLTESQLRLAPVLAGTVTILLFGAAVEISASSPCLIAALLFAFAPLPVYYNRYFIHESLFVAATLGLILSGWRACKNEFRLVRRAGRILRRADARVQGNRRPSLLRAWAAPPPSAGFAIAAGKTCHPCPDIG